MCYLKLGTIFKCMYLTNVFSFAFQIAQKNDRNTLRKKVTDSAKRTTFPSH